MTRFRGVKKFQLVEVRWRDSAAEMVSWKTQAEATDWLEGDELITTVGYFFTASKTSAILVMSRGVGDEDVGGLWSIPLACIVSVRRLR